MKSKLKHVLVTGLLLAAVGSLTGNAQAASTDTITLSVSPGVTYAVSITSPYASGYSFGQVNLNTTTQSTMAIVVTNTGNIYEYFGISVSNTSGNWAASLVAPSTDTFRMSAVLNAGVQPALADAGFSILSTMAPATANGQFGQAGKTSPSAGNNQRSLWLKLEMPYTLDVGGAGAQTMTLSVTGQAS